MLLLIFRLRAPQLQIGGERGVPCSKQACRAFSAFFCLNKNRCVMNKTYQFRMYPTKKQETTLNEWLALCCQVYNAALQERRDAYRMAGLSLGFAHQCAELPACKQVCPELAQVNAQGLPNVV